MSYDKGMTSEHKRVFDLTEIKAVIFACNSCTAKIAFAPDDVKAPPDRCPSGHTWDWNKNTGYRSTDSPFRGFLSALVKLRDPLCETGFRILLEIDEKP